MDPAPLGIWRGIFDSRGAQFVADTIQSRVFDFRKHRSKLPKSSRLGNGEAIAESVAQTSSLLYRGFPIRGLLGYSTAVFA